jgi:D-threo-aldose 1-dehydrogenase
MRRPQENTRLGTGRPIAGGNLELPVLGFGGAAIGNLYSPVGDEEAEATIVEAYGQGIRYFDTAPFYGYGLSERRLGRVLSQPGCADAIISTKVGRLILKDESCPSNRDGFAVGGYRSVFDYSRSGVMRSFDESLARLRRSRVDILLLHDVGRATHGASHAAKLKEALDEALPAMAELKAMGACRAIGIGVNEEAVCLEVMAHFDLDCILLAGRYTLLEQSSLDGVMAEAQRRHVAILVGGAFNSGLLANADAPGQTYDYQPVDAEKLRRAQRIYQICAAEKVDVGAAALQFALAHGAVASVVAGMRSTTEVRSAVKRIQTPLPPTLWKSFRDAGILAPLAPTP